MVDDYQTSFMNRLGQMDNDALLRTLAGMDAKPDEYQPAAIAAARDEVARRGLTSAQQGEVAARVKQEAFDGLQEEATRLALMGHDRVQIAERLKTLGIDHQTAAELAEGTWDTAGEQLKRAGRRNMKIGAALFFGAILISAVTRYIAATTPGGGRYAIFWGLMLVGFLQFFRGMSQATRNA